MFQRVVFCLKVSRFFKFSFFGLQASLRIGRRLEAGELDPVSISIIKRNNCGKALDIAEGTPTIRSDVRCGGSKDCSALAGAELVIVPQAGAVGEWPDGLYEAELRVAAFQNGYFTALCNRVGPEEHLTFAGE